MSTASIALKSIPEFGKQVKDFIWSADGYEDKAGFNYTIDKNSSVSMLKQEIPVKIVRNFNRDSDFYNDELLNSIDSVKSVYARKISSFLQFIISKKP